MNVKKVASTLTLILAIPFASSCTSYSAYQKARAAEVDKNWDVAVAQYEKALDVSPENSRFRMSLQRAKLEASRLHFERAKSLMAAAQDAHGGDRDRLFRMAATELELTVRLDPTNQYAAVEMSKIVDVLEAYRKAQAGESIDEMKRRAGVTKAKPPELNPASSDPISLSFPRETPVKDIYRALGNAFGINILFDQAVKDDRISIELRDVTAQQALERVMQAANHFYKVLDEKSIIVVPDNPQARRDYEDLVIQTFYLSNGDAEQVLNVVRTMIEARNVFPLKALNAITIRDTADKVRIAEKIIQANDKAKAEVVVDVELLQLDLNKIRDLGAALTTSGSISAVTLAPREAGEAPGTVRDPLRDKDGKTIPFTGGTLAEIANSLGNLGRLQNSVSMAIPTASYSFMKSAGESELLANPELRISEGEKATLHIGQRIPVPVTTFSATVGGTTGGQSGVQPFTSYQYQDVGIKVSMEPRVHHNREVTLKLSVEVSNVGPEQVPGQPTFATRTIESTIRLKDGETNFLAGLIQDNKDTSSTKTPFLGDIPFLGRLFTKTRTGHTRTDLVLTMTPHIIRIPDITEDDVAPMWVGTTNNITFRGVSPRIESQAGIDPFVAPSRSAEQFNPTNLQLSSDGEPGNYIVPEGRATTGQPAQSTPFLPQGSGPTDPFRGQQPPVPAPATTTSSPIGNNTTVPAPAPDVPTGDDSGRKRRPNAQSNSTEAAADDAMVSASVETASDAMLSLAPRVSPQPSAMSLKPGESKLWNIVGMDLDGLTTPSLVFRFDPSRLYVSDVTFGGALEIDPQHPPVATIDRERGYVKISSSDGKPLRFRSGGEVVTLRVSGGSPGETFLVIDKPVLNDKSGLAVQSAITGGRARVN